MRLTSTQQMFNTLRSDKEFIEKESKEREAQINTLMDEVQSIKSKAETAKGDSTYSISELTKKLRIAKESTTNFENKVKELKE